MLEFSWLDGMERKGSWLLLAIGEKSLIKCHLTLFLNSPLKANWFSGFPSGTLYILNQSSVACRNPGLSLRTSSMSVNEGLAEIGHHHTNNYRCTRERSRTVEVFSLWVLHIYNDDFPVGFSFVYERQSPQHLHTDDLPSRANLHANTSELRYLSPIALMERDSQMTNNKVDKTLQRAKQNIDNYRNAHDFQDVKFIKSNYQYLCFNLFGIWCWFNFIYYFILLIY